jgi:hypothetical protein
MVSINRLFIASLILFSTEGFSQSKDTVIAAPAANATITTAPEPAKKEEGVFKFSGFFDFNYFKNLNNPQSGSNTGIILPGNTDGTARAFDRRENQFQLGLVQTKFTYTRSKSDVVIDLVFGPHADLGNYGNYLGPLGAGKGTTSLAIKQAYFNYRFTKKLTFTAGQFGTHVGYEVIDAPLNYNYSLSNLFNNGPFYHIGMKASYAITPKMNLMAGIVNNWDNLYDNNKFKTAIAQFNYNPSSRMAIYLNYVGGDEVTNTNPNDPDTLHQFRQLLDLVINWQVTDKFYIGLNVVGGQQTGLERSTTDTTQMVRTSKNWGGVALYTNYQVSKHFGFGIRGEFFDNTAGVMYIGQTDVKSLTITGKISLDDDHLFIKPEIRYDVYKYIYYNGPGLGYVQQFQNSEGNYDLNTQLTIGGAFIYKF